MRVGRFFGLSLLVASPALGAALPRTIEFSEETPRPILLLDGRGYYSDRGLSFSDEVYLLSDKRFLSAGRDRWGITTLWEENHRFAVEFEEGASQVRFDWVSLWSEDFSATAYWRGVDGYHKLGEYEVSGLVPRLNFGQGALEAVPMHPIDRIVFNNTDGFIGVGRLEYQPVATAVPLPPAAWAGIALLLSLAARKVTGH